MLLRPARSDQPSSRRSDRARETEQRSLRESEKPRLVSVFRCPDAGVRVLGHWSFSHWGGPAVFSTGIVGRKSARSVAVLLSLVLCGALTQCWTGDALAAPHSPLAMAVTRSGPRVEVGLTTARNASCSSTVAAGGKSMSFPTARTTPHGTLRYSWKIPKNAPAGAWAVKAVCKLAGHRSVRARRMFRVTSARASSRHQPKRLPRLTPRRVRHGGTANCAGMHHGSRRECA